MSKLSELIQAAEVAAYTGSEADFAEAVEGLRRNMAPRGCRAWAQPDGDALVRFRFAAGVELLLRFDGFRLALIDVASGVVLSEDEGAILEILTVA